MKDFQFYVTDDRYSVPSFLVVTTRDDRAARSMAARMLANEHYHSVEVWDGERRLFSLRRTSVSGESVEEAAAG